MAYRYDSGELGTIERTPAGGIKVPAYVTRSGVFLYRGPNGETRRELRPPEEVFSEDSLASLKNAPVTDLHPAVPVTPDNWKALTVGHVGEDVKADGTHVSAPLVIQDAAEIRLIDSRERRELSCGYRCDLDMVSGDYRGERYDAIQRNIRYNHVALGPDGWGRAGSSVALRLDSGDAIQIENDSRKEHIDMKIRIDGKEYDLSTPQGKADAEAAIAKLQSEKDTATGRADAAETQNGKLATELAAAKDPKAIQARAQARADLLVTGRTLAEKTGQKFDEKAAEGQTDLQLMSAMIGIMDPTFNAEGKTDDYIRGVFSAYTKVAASGADKAATKTGETPPADAGTSGNAATPPPADPNQPKTDGKTGGIFQARETVDAQGKAPAKPKVDADESRKRNDAENKDAWKRPLSYSKDSPAAK